MSKKETLMTATKENTMNETDAFREYIDQVRPPDPPRAEINDIELLSQTIAIRIWAFRTKHSLATVMRPDFFDGLKDVRLRKNDRIEVIASWDEPLAEHATLCVDRVSGTGEATVSLMHLYERSQ
jgi:hypothetical protein